MQSLQLEMRDVERALAEIDRVIVRKGFQQPAPEAAEDSGSSEEDSVSIKAKDGTVLGTVQIGEREIIVVPSEGIDFSVSTPPFQSFLVDRVLANMRSSDETRVSNSEIPPEDVLSFEVSTDGERIRRMVVRNYGGERRLREIRSSLRWTFDKMYDKMRQG